MKMERDKYPKFYGPSWEQEAEANPLRNALFFMFVVMPLFAGVIWVLSWLNMALG